MNFVLVLQKVFSRSGISYTIERCYFWTIQPFVYILRLLQYVWHIVRGGEEAYIFLFNEEKQV